MDTPWWQVGTVSPEGGKQAAPVVGSQGSSMPFMALMAFTAILLIAPQQMFPVLAPFRIAMLSFLLAIAAHFASQLARGHPIIRFDRGVVLVLWLVAWAVITIPFSMWPGGSISYLLEAYLKTVLVFLLLVNVVTTLPKLRWMLWGLVVASVPLSITTLSNMAGGAGYGDAGRVIGYDAPLTENPNDMALMLNLILPLAIGLFLVNKRFLLKAALAMMIMLMVAGIIATFSRAGFLTLTVTMLCYAWFLRHRAQRGFVLLAFFLVLAALPMLPETYVDRLSTITEVQSDTTGSSQARMRDTVAAFNVAMRNPVVGAGIGMGTLAMNEARGSTWTEIHNVYLMFAVDLGLPGLVLFLMLLVCCFSGTHQVMDKTRGHADGEELFGMAEAIKVSLIAFCVAAFFHPVAYHFYFYYIGGLAICLPTILAGRNNSLTSVHEDTKKHVRL